MAKQMGKIRHIGLTGYPLAKMANIVANSHVKIDVVLSYCRGTMADGTLGSYMAFFQVCTHTRTYSAHICVQNKGVAVVNAAATSMGLLTPQGPPAWHPAPRRIKDACRQSVEYCMVGADARSA
jgi:hypothetical protein